MNERENPGLHTSQDVVEENWPNNDKEDNEIDDKLDWNQLSRKSSSAESGLADSDELGISWDHVPLGKNEKNAEDFDALELCSTASGLELRSEDQDEVTSYSDSDEENFCMDYSDIRRCDTITEEEDEDESGINVCSRMSIEKTNDEWTLCGKGSCHQTSTLPEAGLTASIDPNSFGIIEDTPQVAKKIETCLLNLEESLQLNGIGLTLVPEVLLHLKHLKMLYFNNNQITMLPQSFFASLPSLRWLDLRHNQLDCLPWNIGEHCNLTTLLLEGNRLKVLPPELGLLPKLRGLNIRNNPLVDPPDHILNLGLHGILHYLRQKVSVFNEREESLECAAIKEESLPSVIRSASYNKLCKTKRNEGLKKPRSLIPYELGADYQGISNEILETRAEEDQARLNSRLRQDQINTVLQHVKTEVALKTWRYKARLEQLEAAASGECSSVPNTAANAPYAIDENCLVMMSRIQLQNGDYGKTSKQYPQPMPGYVDAVRRRRERELERQIWLNLEKLQESAKNGSVDLDEAAEQLAEVERLHKELTTLFRNYF